MRKIFFFCSATESVMQSLAEINFFLQCWAIYPQRIFTTLLLHEFIYLKWLASKSIKKNVRTVCRRIINHRYSFILIPIRSLTFEHVNGISKSAPPINRNPNGFPDSLHSFTSTTIFFSVFFQFSNFSFILININRYKIFSSSRFSSFLNWVIAFLFPIASLIES